jgi:drug/metabolite transporter (DMT)-like permease
MAWILLATAGQFLNALVAFLDKYIVSDEKALPKPFVYAFYSCILTGGWILIYLLGFVPGLQTIGVPHLSNVVFPTIQVVAMAFLSAYTFFMALVSMYSALRSAEAVNVMPVIGVISAISSLGMVYLFLDVTLQPNFIWGIIVLSLGTLLVAQTLPQVETIVHVVHSGVFFALHFITMKGLFQETSFDDGFFWSRVCFVLFALSLLLVPTYYKKIREQTGTTTKKTGFLVVFAKVLAGVAAFMILKATDMGDVAVVQALDGIKFVFILLISIFFGALLPDSVVEHVTKPSEVMRRVLYVAIIVVGYFILFSSVDNFTLVSQLYAPNS